jgi:hypothetical protein
MQNPDSDESRSYAAIAEVVRDYVEGLVQCDAAKLRRAMHERACEIGHFDGELLWQDRETMIAMMEKMAAEPDLNPDWRIHSISIDGDVAIVRVEDDWVGSNYLDVITLLHHDGGWMIVSKVFHQRQGG